MNNKKLILNIVFAAILTAIGVVLFYFSFTINLFGVPALRIDFITIPIMIAGFILGKWYGLTVGALVDLIGYFSASSVNGGYFFGFTLNLALVGFVAGFLPELLKKISPKATQFTLITLLTMSVTASVTYIAVTPEIRLGTENFVIDTNVKILLILSIILLLLLSIFFFMTILRETRFSTENLNKIIVTMLFAELVLITLTPIWVYILYQNPPIFVGFVSRLIRASFMFPIKVIGVLAILNALKQQDIVHIEVLS